MDCILSDTGVDSDTYTGALDDLCESSNATAVESTNTSSSMPSEASGPSAPASASVASKPTGVTTIVTKGSASLPTSGSSGPVVISDLPFAPSAPPADFATGEALKLMTSPVAALLVLCGVIVLM